MTETRQKLIATEFRRRLDHGELVKNALRDIERDFKVSHMTIYRICKRFGVSTRS